MESAQEDESEIEQYISDEFEPVEISFPDLELSVVSYQLILYSLKYCYYPGKNIYLCVFFFLNFNLFYYRTIVIPTFTVIWTPPLPCQLVQLH